jgi:hypothetical protein
MLSSSGKQQSKNKKRPAMTGGLADLTVAEVRRSPDTAILVDPHLPGVANVALDVVQLLPLRGHQHGHVIEHLGILNMYLLQL